MSDSEPILVVGAGIVGVACALQLLRRGRAVTLVDRLDPGEGASFGNAGVLASSSIVPVTTPGLLASVPRMLFDPDGPVFVKWGYLPRMTPWLIRYLSHCRTDRVQHIARHLAPLVSESFDEHVALAHGTAAERRIHRIPYAFVYRSAEAFANDSFGWGLRRQHGITWETLTGEAVREAEPGLSPAYRFLVVLAEQHGIIESPGAYVAALAGAFAAGGGTVLRREVRVLMMKGGRVVGVRLADGTELDAAQIVLAAGAWSAQLLAPLGVKVPMESERGYHVELEGASVMPNHALMIADRKFVATPMGGTLRLAGLVEFGGLAAPPSAAPIALLARQLQAVFPGVSYDAERSWMGHRPAPADSLPLIGPISRLPGLFLAFGHHHVGLTSGPRTGRLVADLVAGPAPNLDLAPYAPDRFS